MRLTLKEMQIFRFFFHTFCLCLFSYFFSNKGRTCRVFCSRCTLSSCPPMPLLQYRWCLILAWQERLQAPPLACWVWVELLVLPVNTLCRCWLQNPTSIDPMTWNRTAVSIPNYIRFLIRNKIIQIEYKSSVWEKHGERKPIYSYKFERVLWSVNHSLSNKTRPGRLSRKKDILKCVSFLLLLFLSTVLTLLIFSS